MGSGITPPAPHTRHSDEYLIWSRTLYFGAVNELFLIDFLGHVVGDFFPVGEEKGAVLYPGLLPAFSSTPGYRHKAAAYENHMCLVRLKLRMPCFIARIMFPANSPVPLAPHTIHPTHTHPSGTITWKYDADVALGIGDSVPTTTSSFSSSSSSSYSYGLHVQEKR